MKRLIVLITLVSFLFSLQVGYAAPLTSTLKDQQDVAVTIYNSNVGLVKDIRLIDFKPGIILKPRCSRRPRGPLARREQRGIISNGVKIPKRRILQ